MTHRKQQKIMKGDITLEALRLCQRASKIGDAEKARTENAAPKCRGGNGENGKVGK